MRKYIDLTGREFGYLTVVKQAPIGKNRNRHWLCSCKCGNTTVLCSNYLTSGHTQSCGCKKFETKNETHNMSNTRIYRIWSNMKQRCYSHKSKDYQNYGGRGIRVCDEWKNDFSSFYKWALDNGYSDGLYIDRKDVDGDYCPDNCKWSSWLEQQRNKTTSLFFEHNGERKTFAEWCEEYGVIYQTAHSRYRRARMRKGSASFDDVFYDTEA